MSANRTHILLLFLSVVIFGAFVSTFIKTIPLVAAQTIYFCEKTIANSVQIPYFMPILLVFFLFLIFIMGLIIFMIQVLRTKAYTSKILAKKVILPKKVTNIAEHLCLQNKIDVIKDASFISFSYGFLRPRICLSTGLITLLTKEELQAVLLHESYHIKNYDPLRLILGKTASRMFFFIPTLKDIQAHFVFSKEIAADQAVIRNSNRQSLISALTAFLSQPTPGMSGVAAFISDNDLERRIFYLTNQQMASSVKLSKLNLSFSLGIVLALFLFLGSSVHAFTMNDKTMDDSYFVCPFSFLDMSSCNKGLQAKNKINITNNMSPML